MTNNLIHLIFRCFAFQCVSQELKHIAYTLCMYNFIFYQRDNKKHNDNREFSLHHFTLLCSCSSCFRLNAFHMCVICHTFFFFRVFCCCCCCSFFFFIKKAYNIFEYHPMRTIYPICALLITCARVCVQFTFIR